ncbi:transglutaminase-like domain-containing protein [Methanobacterium alcaliphilum]|uniref:transglutaminase-like domain-containing protein n=1 Tax=Methanobacterium alcaliphilum TaxID=392018 RepID=UPI00200B2EA5|nr:transglutaminase-like domain-containing protein [Methanobacterium alcaliphilum]MCK9150753.1 transglutaminase-like domain-containing protein [Methanobacterium alcaliphilum]
MGSCRYGGGKISRKLELIFVFTICIAFLGVNGIHAESANQSSLDNANSSSGSIGQSSANNNSSESDEDGDNSATKTKSSMSLLASDPSTNTATSNVTVNNTNSTTKYYTVTVKVPYKYWYKKKVKVAHKRYYKKRFKAKYKQYYKTWYKYQGKYYSKWKYTYKYKWTYKWVKKVYYTYKYKWTYKIKYKTVTKTTTTPPNSTSTVNAATTSNYLKSSDNCQVSSSTIQAKAKSLTKGLTTTKAKATKIFNWVRDNLKYSFYYNTKYGAVKTLKYMKGNCVDHSHLLVALMRAAGIKSRYMHVKGKFNSGSTYGHVIAEVYVGGKWLKADATSYRNTLGTIKSWTLVKLKGRYTSLPF